MHPMINENIFAVLIAVVSSFAFGWIWYGPLFGKVWMKLMNMPKDMKPNASMMMKSMALGLIGTFLMVHVMVHTTNIWRASVWSAGADMEWYIYGCYSGFYTWLGFFIPMGLSSVAWEGRSWKLFGLNMAYSFFNLQIIAMIVAYMHGMAL